MGDQNDHAAAEKGKLHQAADIASQPSIAATPFSEIMRFHSFKSRAEAG